MPPDYAPCVLHPNDCAHNGTYVSFLGGTPASWQQITSEQHPCLVGRPCVLAPEAHPVVATPEISPWATVAFGLALLMGASLRWRRA